MSPFMTMLKFLSTVYIINGHDDFVPVCCYWSGLRGSNPPPRPWQGRALPNELNPHVVPPVGIEPTTRGFSVPCSTNWATEAYRIKKWRPEGDSNPWPLAWQASVLTNWTTGPFGGNNRARTCDPLLVRQVLSQLSYAPMLFAFFLRRALL